MDGELRGDGNNTAPTIRGAQRSRRWSARPRRRSSTTASSAVTLGTTAPTLSDTAVRVGRLLRDGQPGVHVDGPPRSTATRKATRSRALATARTARPAQRCHDGHGGGHLHVDGELRWRRQQQYSADDQGGTAEQTVVSAVTPTIIDDGELGVHAGNDGADAERHGGVVGRLLRDGQPGVHADGPRWLQLHPKRHGHGHRQRHLQRDQHALPTTGTVAGTYTWTVSYAGDGNNNSAGRSGRHGGADGGQHGQRRRS